MKNANRSNRRTLPMAPQKNRSSLLTLIVVLLWGLGVLILAQNSTLATAQTWTHVQAPFDLGGADLLLTDGRVLLQDRPSGNWFTLTPKPYTLDYHNGNIVSTGSLPAGYAPEFYASSVLPDGRAIVEGGEYNNGIKDHTNLGAIYDPVAGAAAGMRLPSTRVQ